MLWRNSNPILHAWAIVATICVLLFLSLPGHGANPTANKLSLVALFADKAMLFINGEQRILTVGQTSPEGVTLVSVDSSRALIERGGRQMTLTLGIGTVFPGSENADAESATFSTEGVTLWADAKGFFHASGSINGTPVQFLVDTGASSIAISSELAQRIGVSFADGDDGVATTAGGLTRMKRVFLDTVSIGDITLRNVEAGVVMGSFPRTPLLGMSFLGQLDMLREGNRMELRRR